MYEEMVQAILLSSEDPEAEARERDEVINGKPSKPMTDEELTVWGDSQERN